MKFLIFIGLIVLILAILANFFWRSNSPVLFQKEWDEFKATFGKSYDDSEIESAKYAKFIENFGHIENHNKIVADKNNSYIAGVNQYSDYTVKEKSKFLLGIHLPNRTKSPYTFLPPNFAKDLKFIDWRNDKLVTPVKNQGLCNASYAFSAIGALEGQHYRKTGNLVSLSEQNIIDCSWKNKNAGCQGGFINNVFSFLYQSGGVNTKTSYPYEGTDTNECRFNKNNIGAIVTSFIDISPGNDEQLKLALTTVGPIAAGIHVTPKFYNYKEGIFEDEACNSNDINHGVLVVGFGEEHGKKYWLLKNSWGKSWGMKGYMKLYRGISNYCGISSAASYPLV